MTIKAAPRRPAGSHPLPRRRFVAGHSPADCEALGEETPIEVKRVMVMRGGKRRFAWLGEDGEVYHIAETVLEPQR